MNWLPTDVETLIHAINIKITFSGMSENMLYVVQGLFVGLCADEKKNLGKYKFKLLSTNEK